jgi:hypothetical protein
MHPRSEPGTTPTWQMPEAAAPYSEVPYPSASVMDVATPEVYAQALLREWSDGRGGLRDGALSAGVRMFFRSGFAAYIESMRRDPGAFTRELGRANLRASLASPLSDSATMLLEDEEGDVDALDRAARLAAAALEFRADFFAGKVPNTDRGHPLEMGQFPNLFGTSTQIESGGERLVRTPNPRTIAVVISGRFYLLELGLDGRDRVPLGELRAGLREIAGRARGETPMVSVGTVSAAGGDARVRAFRELGASPTSRESLAELARAAFVVCLDTDGPIGDPGAWFHAKNVANRWYNASVQIVVGKDASAAVILNYRCYLDGNVMTSFGEYLWDRAKQSTATNSGEPPPASIRELHWEVSPATLELCRSSIAPIVYEGRSTVRIEGVGRSSMLRSGVAPDAVFTHALMLAVRRLTGRVPRVTQYLAMNRFRSMGITTAMVTTAQSMQAVEAVRSGQGGDARAHALVRRAAQEHEAIQQASRGIAPLSVLLRLYLAQTSKWGAVPFRVLALLAPPVEIQISHPRLRPGIVRIGRPGITRQAIRDFAGHYSLGDDHVDLIVMPSRQMRYSVDQLATELQSALHDWLRVAAGSAGGRRGV